MKTTKAYKNPQFLMSEEARTVRILCEYLEPQTRFRRFGIERAVIFFGSARLKPKPAEGPDYFTLAAELAEKVAAWTVSTHPQGRRYHICTGGGPGIMEAAHAGAARVDRRLNVALNISLPFEQSVNEFVEADHAFEFHYFFMRKFWFKNVAQAMVVFPGGFGTLDELFEMLTLIQTSKGAHIPIVLFGREFWTEVIDFEALARRGLIGEEDLRLIYRVDSVEAAFRHLKEVLP
ncbi:MAG: LOG family protein [Gammaproteobacteria bacterium]|nr:LOG family protein [Gammaproteobacteria bacterium]